MSEETQIELKGSCFCGTISYKVVGKPVLSAYCHCTNCQRLTGCPMLWTIHYPGSSFFWTHPTPYDIKLDFYVQSNKNHKKRARCHNCGCAVASYNSRKDTWSIWGTQLLRDPETKKVREWDVVKPNAHIFYDTRVLDVVDNLSKWDGYEGSSNRLG